MSLTQLGGERGGVSDSPYIYNKISEYITQHIHNEIKKLLQEKITPIKDHLKRLIDNRSMFTAAKFSNVIKEKLFAVPPNEDYKKYPFITSGRLLELLTRVKQGNDKFVVFDVYDADGFVVTQEGDTLKYNTGIDIAEFIKTTYGWTDELYYTLAHPSGIPFGPPSTEQAETERRRQIIEERNREKTKNNKEIMVMVGKYMEKITRKIEEKFEGIKVPTDISENDAHKPAEPLSAANGAVIEEKKSTTGGQRRNRKSKKARKTKKARKSRKNRRKSNRRRR